MTIPPIGISSSLNSPMPEMKLRRAWLADVAEITTLVRSAYARHVPRIGREPMPMTADYGAAVRAHQVWVQDAADGIVAVLELIPAVDHLLVENIAVRPALQGKGIGRGLMAFAEREAHRQGLPEMRLFTNARMFENIALYTRLGFHETGREAFKDSVLVHMAKRLAPVTTRDRIIAGVAWLKTLGRGPRVRSFRSG